MKKIRYCISILLVIILALVGCGENGGSGGTTNTAKKELTSEEVYAKNNPSVVFVLLQQSNGYSSGSGFFIDTNGTLVTNFHVIKNSLLGAIQLSDGTSAKITNVLGYSEDADIAILSTEANNTTAVKISKEQPQVGETVYAIGYPQAFQLGVSSSTFTSGMISNYRSINNRSYIQATVDITNGNSGGALINKYGEVIGITTSGLRFNDIDYMNLSIPIQRIETVGRNSKDTLEAVTKRINHYPVYVTYYTDDTKYLQQRLTYENCAVKPTDPKKAGYTFLGWYTDQGCTKKYDFSTKVIDDISLYAKFELGQSYSISYNLNSGRWKDSSPKTRYSVEDCGKALPIPIRSGYLFEGWKTSSGKYIDNYPSANNLTSLSLSASWIAGAEGLILSATNNYCAVTDFNDTSSSVSVPATYRGYTVKEISFAAFREHGKNLTSITLPNTITTIRSEAFSGCSSLTKINLPDSITILEDYAFANSRFRSIKLPNKITTIKEGLFMECNNLEYVVIPSGVTSIEMGAFYECTSLSRIFYCGNNTKWNSITINNDEIEDTTKTILSNAKKYWYSESKPSSNIGDYWHYVNNIPTVWQ